LKTPKIGQNAENGPKGRKIGQLRRELVINAHILSKTPKNWSKKEKMVKIDENRSTLILTLTPPPGSAAVRHHRMNLKCLFSPLLHK
jgi:hypothetical protein